MFDEKGVICVEEEKFRLPVDVRGSKTSVLKLPNIETVRTSLLVFTIYSRFDKGCPTEVKRTRQCRLVLWVVRVWRCLIGVHGFEQEERKKYEYTGLYCFLLHAETS